MELTLLNNIFVRIIVDDNQMLNVMLTKEKIKKVVYDPNRDGASVPNSFT